MLPVEDTQRPIFLDSGEKSIISPFYPSFLPREGKYIKTHVGGSKYLIIG